MTTTSKPKSSIDKIAVNQDGVWTRNIDTGLWTLQPDFHGNVTPLQLAFRRLELGLWTIDPFTGQVSTVRTGKVIGHTSTEGYVYLNPYQRLQGRSAGLKVCAHRVIWQRFHGPIHTGQQINHLDGVKTHNALSNLELVTGSDNIRHAYRLGLNGVTKRLTPDTVRAIRAVYAETHSNRVTADRTGATIRQVLGVTKNTTFKRII